METTPNPLKHRISRMFRSSFASCKFRNVSDVIERPVSNRQHYQLVELFSPKPRPFRPSLCRPKWSEMTESELFPRRKVSDRNSLLCPPVSPISPLNAFSEFGNYEFKSRERKPRKKKKKKIAQLDKKGRKREKKKDNSAPWHTNISNNYYDWSTTDDDSDFEDDDKTTLFSSKSLSSDSSDSFRRNKAHHHRQKSATIKPEADDRTAVMPSSEMQGGKMKEGFAVVKKSSDPYNDFRTSMVEMIVEKQIFGARELEGLLQTFLSLNSYHHHSVIIEVFTEIWEALFSDWS